MWGTSVKARTAVAGLLLSLLWAVAVSAAAGQTTCDDDWSDGDRERWCEMREQSLPVTSRIDIDAGANGGISVEGWDRDRIELRAKVWAYASSESRAEAMVDDIRIEVSNGRIQADGPDQRRRESWGVSYELRVPRDTDLDLETLNGGIGITNVNGDTRFRAVNGGVHLERMAGRVEGRTTNGGLHVELDGDRWDGRGLDVRTTNGGVTLRIPEGYSADLETGTVNGGIDVDFPVTVQGRIGRTLNATLGDGGPPVKVATTNGGVRITRGGRRSERPREVR